MCFFYNVIAKKRILGMLILCISLMIGWKDAGRIHGKVFVQNASFTESNRQLENPYRGFYMIYGFIIGHENSNLNSTVIERIKDDPRAIAMIQINLGRYTKGPISNQGMEDVEYIFSSLEQLDKQYIVRFLYDWEGLSIKTEPQDVEIILNHMRQLKDILYKYSDKIFIQQGLFIGNWGEMNGTKHLGEMKRLALQLAAVTGEKTFLSVRMPSQWRFITGIADLSFEAIGKSSLVRRMGLFNDGIMGNRGDYGTYGTKSRTEVGDYGLWIREEELEFQNELCRYVPNGGEVIVENPMNDFENAVRDLATMHITYLNYDYDRNVLKKWEKSIISDGSCFDGMDGLAYIERHLGYRLLIYGVSINYNFWSDDISLNIRMKNEGFAPLYKEPEKYIRILNKASNEITTYLLTGELRSLYGGNDSEKVYSLRGDVSLYDFETGEYEIFFCIKDMDSNHYIELANTEEMQEYGYKIGSIVVEEKKKLYIMEPLDLFNSDKKYLRKIMGK